MTLTDANRNNEAKAKAILTRLPAPVYARFKELCDKRGIPMQRIMERYVNSTILKADRSANLRQLRKRGNA